MKDYLVQKFVDYLTVTSHKPNIGAFGKKVYQIIKPINQAYDSAEMHQSGMIHMWHTRKPKLGHHYVMSGKPMAWIREHIMNDTELIEAMMQHGDISRIDIAVTSMPSDGSEHELQPHKIMEMCRDGLLISRLKPAKEIAENGQTETKYIGNPRKRRRLFRAYDKGIQLDLDEYKNREIRYELETGLNANVIGRMLVDGNDIGAIIRRYVDFPSSDVWMSVMSAKNSSMTHKTGEISIDAIERSRMERAAKWLWLNESIAPMIARQLYENEELDDLTMYENGYWHDFVHEIMRRTRK